MAEEAVTMKKSDLVDAMRVLGEELKKPDAETAARQEAEKARILASKTAMRQVVVEEQQVNLCRRGECEHKRKWSMERGGECHAEPCNHLKPNGKLDVGGQIFSDGFYRSICLICQHQFPPQAVTPQMVVGGVASDGAGGFGSMTPEAPVG